MPYTNVSGTASSVVYYPATSGVPHAFLFNPGPSPIWLGGNSGISTATGIQLAPNNSVRLNTAAGTIYGIGGYTAITPSGTANAATTYPGGTLITVASGGTVFTAGMAIVIEAGTPRQEITSVTASNAGSVFTSPAMIFAHGSATVFSQITPVAAVIRADRGTS
jgi:hypothetical protein